MFERESKREKILEARQREVRLKERSRSEQSREEEAGREEGEEDPKQLIVRAESDFYSLVEAEVKRREKKDEVIKVRRKKKSFSFGSFNSVLTAFWSFIFQEKDICEEKDVKDEEQKGTSE